LQIFVVVACRIIDQKGYFYVAQDGAKTQLQCCGKVLELCHQGTLDYLGVTSDELRGALMCAGGIQGYVRGSLGHEKVCVCVCACVRVCSYT
jgi:hypothetical protein